jgi:hypothetical protein
MVRGGRAVIEMMLTVFAFALVLVDTRSTTAAGESVGVVRYREVEEGRCCNKDSTPPP